MRQRLRTGQAQCSDDCRYAAARLAACDAEDIAAGLRAGQAGLRPPLLARVPVPVTLLLAPDAPGVNHLEDATALRGPERTATTEALRAAIQVAPAGHCIHRDHPNALARRHCHDTN